MLYGSWDIGPPGSGLIVKACGHKYRSFQTGLTALAKIFPTKHHAVGEAAVTSGDLGYPVETRADTSIQGPVGHLVSGKRYT